jgi:hypothetical protein
MATINSLTVSALCAYIPGTFRAFACMTLGPLGAAPFSSTHPVLLNTNGAFSLQIKGDASSVFYGSLATQLQNLIDGTWFANFQLFATLGGSSVPFDAFRIYAAWACVGFDDGSFKVYRPTTFQTIEPGLPNSQVINPGNIVDSDFSTFGEVDQIQYAFGGGAAAVIGVTNFALSTAPATTWTPSTVQISGSSVVDLSGHIQIATGAGGITGLTTPAWNDAGGNTTDGTVIWADGGTTACNLSPPVSTLAVACGSPPNGTIGSAYSHTFLATGGTPGYTYSRIAGAFPTGLSLDPATGILSGTLTAGGTFNFTVQVTDSLAATANTGNCSITVSTLSLPCGNPPNGIYGTAYSKTFTATGGTPGYTYSLLSGTFPTGLTLDPTTGVLSGTLTAGGFFTFVIQVTDTVPNTANTGGCSIGVSAQLTVKGGGERGGGEGSCGTCSYTYAERREMARGNLMGTSTTGPVVYSPSQAKEFVDIDDTLTFNYVLAPGQVINALQQPVGGDGDFWLCGIQMTSVLRQRPDLIELAGNAGMRIADDTGYRLMSDFLNIAFLTPLNGNSYPWVIRPAHLFKAGTRISIDMQELSNVIDDVTGPVPNIIQIGFRGRYRYRVSDLKNQTALLRRIQKRQGGR